MTDPATPDPVDLDQIKARRAALDSTPWKTFDHDSMVIGVSRGFPYSVKSLPVAVHLRQCDAQFIAHAPTDIDLLIGEVERLRGQLEMVTGAWEGSQKDEVKARTLLLSIRTQLYHFFEETS